MRAVLQSTLHLRITYIFSKNFVVAVLVYKTPGPVFKIIL